MDTVLSKIYSKTRFKRYLSVVVGFFICAFTYNLLILPNDIVFGGLSGLSIIVNNFITITPAIFIFVCSIILCFFSFIFLSKESTFRSLVGAIVFPIFVELTSGVGKYIPIEGGDPFLFALFGGVLYGFGLGLIMRSGFTLGGTDKIGRAHV